MRTRLIIEPYSPLKPTKVSFIFIGPNSLSWAEDLAAVNHVTQAVIRLGSKIESQCRVGGITALNHGLWKPKQLPVIVSYSLISCLSHAFLKVVVYVFHLFRWNEINIKPLFMEIMKCPSLSKSNLKLVRHAPGLMGLSLKNGKHYNGHVLLAHELGHIMGVTDHDGEGSARKCQGKTIMKPSVQEDFTKWSACSR